MYYHTRTHDDWLLRHDKHAQLSQSRPAEKVHWADPGKSLQQFIYSAPSELRTNLQSAIETIDSVLRIYSLPQICIGFNGGKDCTILLHLLRCRIDA